MLTSFLIIPAFAIQADSYILLDENTGRVIERKNENKRSLIASTTKIMTALIVCEQTNVLDRVRIPDEAVGVEGSSIYLKAGEILTVQELLYGLMLHSGNDAAVALAIYCGGTVGGFAQLMNDKAHQLGLVNTHFSNPHGLDAPDHYSCASDLAVLTAYAMKNPVFAKTVSTKTVTIQNRCLRNHNKLLWQVQGADGVKTGFTKASGRILVSSAQRQGRRLICVTIDDPNDWQDHSKLLEKGFSLYSVCEIVKKDQFITTVEVAAGKSGTVQLLAADSFSYSVSESEKISVVPPPYEFVYAPVTEGAFAGYANVLLDNCSVGKVALYYGQTVEQEKTEIPFWKKLLKGVTQ